MPLLMAEYKIGGIPVGGVKKLIGIVTNRDLRFEKKSEEKVSEVMTKDQLVTAKEDVDLVKAEKHFVTA